MKITYLEHSGFTIEHEDVVMIFYLITIRGGFQIYLQRKKCMYSQAMGIMIILRERYSSGRMHMRISNIFCPVILRTGGRKAERFIWSPVRRYNWMG